MYHLYDFLPSGNGYKVRLLLTQLAIPFTRTEVNILKGETRTPDFLAKNLNGRIPVLEVMPKQFLAESNAILFYLSRGTNYFPVQPLEQAQVMQWLFFEQYSHEPNIATPRYWLKILGQTNPSQDQLTQKQKQGYAALAVMERHLTHHAFLVGEQYTIADIGLYAYTHVADEGGFDLTPFSAIQAWLQRVHNQPRYIPITSNNFAHA